MGKLQRSGHCRLGRRRAFVGRRQIGGRTQGTAYCRRKHSGRPRCRRPYDLRAAASRTTVSNDLTRRKRALLGSRCPIDAYEVSAFIEILVEVAVQGAFHGFADPARQVDVCRIDDDSVSILLDRNNTVERMFALFGFLLMACQANDLLLLLASKSATQHYDASRKFVVYPPASRTRRFVAVLKSRPPLPASLVIDCTALWADGIVG